MSDVSLFSGKLTRQSLPTLTPGPGVEMPTLKRLVLAQGGLAQFHDSETAVHYIASLELTVGSPRGNHYHDRKKEHIYLMSGAVELIAREIDTGADAALTLESGDLVVIQPGVAHAFRVLKEGVAIEFAPTRFDPTDVHPLQLT